MKTTQKILILFFLFSAFIVKAEEKIPNYANNILKEKLGRGLVAIHQDGATSVSWRFLKGDTPETAFDLYRVIENGKSIKLNKKPIKESTYFVDKTGDISKDQRYILRISGQKETLAEYSLTKERAAIPYISIPIKPVPNDTLKRFHPNDASIGDLDGDGEMEIVLKRLGAGFACSQAGMSPLSILIEAYKMDGTLLWTVDLGVNIRQGAQYLQFLVYDFDGCGKAEVAVKTSEGTTFGDGQVIGDTNNDGVTDYVNREVGSRIYGKILTGPEFFSVLDGMTGKELARGPWIERGRSEDWGDNYGNRVDRQLGAVGFFDGKNPGIFWGRGYNGRSAMQAWNFINGKLTLLWTFDTRENGLKDYESQGNHNIRIGDVDGDGKDEIIYGACAIDHDGSPLYSTKLGHGDAMHMSDFDPTRPGLEVFQVHEYSPNPSGTEFRDARTGEILVGLPSTSDVGRGLCADIDPRYYGAEFWSIQSGGVRSVKGELISKNTPSINFAIWWDGDLSRELLDGVRIDKWNGDGVNNLFDGKKYGVESNNGTKKNPCLAADIFGDWREELMVRSEKNDEIRIYMTPYETKYRMPSLLQDIIYRHSVAHQNVGYNQPTAPGFYLGTDNPNKKK